MHLGTHIIMDFFGCDREKLNDVNYVESELIKAALIADAHILGKHFHHTSSYILSTMECMNTH